MRRVSPHVRVLVPNNTLNGAYLHDSIWHIKMKVIIIIKFCKTNNHTCCSDCVTLDERCDGVCSISTSED